MEGADGWKVTPVQGAITPHSWTSKGHLSGKGGEASTSHTGQCCWKGSGLSLQVGTVPKPTPAQSSPEDRLRLHHDFSAAQHPLLPSPATSPPSVTVPAPPGRAAMPAPVSRASIPGSQAVTLLTSLEERLRPR